MRWNITDYRGFSEGSPSCRVKLYFDSVEEFDVTVVMAGLYYPSLLFMLTDRVRGQLIMDSYCYDVEVQWRLLELRDKVKEAMSK